MIAWAVEALLASALLIALVLAIRVPVRRLFGAQVAYALWALPVLRLALPPLPAMWRDRVATPIADMGQQVTVLILPAADAGAPAAAYPALGTLALGAWCAGAALFLAWHLLTYARFCRRLLANATPLDRIAGVTVVETAGAAGPLAFGIARRFVAFPRDFAARYDANERALALAHELGHHARGDLIANWVALVVLALHWCNPLAWFAFRAFRADQEMANDARVLAGRGPHERHAYACAIVKSAHGGAISAACHLHTVNDLKGRLRMLATNGASRGRLLAGMAGVAALTLTGLGLTASGTQAAQTVRNGVEQATGIDLSAIATAKVPADVTARMTAKRDQRVVIVKDGQTTTYEGTAAEAYIAANPVPIPPVPPMPPIAPVPPVPPMPPMPPVSADAAARADYHAVVREENCQPEDGRQTILQAEAQGARVTILCTNRIARIARIAEARARNGEGMERRGYAAALSGLRQARARIAGNHNMPAEGRAEALAAIDESIAEMEENLAERH